MHKIETHNALILFVDVIDSCQYSAYLGTDEYARQILSFQEHFINVSESFFPKIEGLKGDFFQSETRGDEGSIILADTRRKPSELIYDAVQLSFELKGLLEISNSLTNGFKPMRVGVGIHFGPISIVSAPDKKVIGYSINIGKRIESLSRVGRYSNIFLSRDAHRLLDTDPILFAKHTADLRGLQSNETVYEVISAYFDDIPRCEEAELKSSELIGYYTKNFANCDFLKNPWQKSLVASLLLSLAKKHKSPAARSTYVSKAYNFCWRDPIEDDPILQYLRALERTEANCLTKAATILKGLVTAYPDFVNARLKLAKVCWALSQTSPISEEIIFARDIADEFLNRYPHVLSDEESSFFRDVASSTRDAKQV